LEPGELGPNNTARPVADGSFTLSPVPQGLHWIRGQAPRGWALKSVIVDGREISDSPLEIRPGEKIPSVTIVFSDRVAEINGTLTDERGQAVTEYTVLAFPTDSTLWRTDSRQIMTTRPDQNGRFQMKGLPPGEYFLAAVDPSEPNEWFDPVFLDQHRPDASRLTLGEGDIKTNDLRVVVR
jgi:hypothetical protein